MGSLIYESRDASGLYYRRNRYYDSEKGRFTQEDPIGLAGGVNMYGFADGDPVTYSDPYGLASDTVPENRSSGAAIAVGAGTATATGETAVAAELVGAVGLGAAAAGALYLAYRETQRVWVTYTLTNPSTGQVYAGRTSGFGTPQSVMMVRFATHHMRRLGFTVPNLDRSMVGMEGEDPIRGREQQLIDHFGGARSDGGTAGNAIRGVNKNNPFGRIYHLEANWAFGELHPYTGRF